MANAMSLDEPDTNIDPYEVLDVDPEADDATIRSAYKKLALKHHPDKVLPSERESAHKLFQSIAFAYAVLSDPKRRRRYDTTGSTAESALDDEDFDWADFFKAQYTEITRERIQEFEKEYKGGAEERSDLLKAYTKHEGNMNRIYQTVMLSNPLNDEERFQTTIKEAIEAGEVEGYTAFLDESEKSRTTRMNNARREAKEAQEHAEDLGIVETKDGEKKLTRKKGRKLDGDVEVEGDASSDEDEDAEEDDYEDFVEHDEDEDETTAHNSRQIDDEDDGDEDEDEDAEEEEEEAPRPARRNTRARTSKPAKPAPKPTPKPKSRPAKSNGSEGMADLAAKFAERAQQRAASSNAFLDQLEAKYAPKSGKGKKRSSPIDEPPEEAFAANRKGSKRSKS